MTSPSRCAELILHICAIDALDRRKPRDRRLFDVLMDQVEASRQIGFQLTLPRDPRALRVARALLDHPSTDRALDAVCAKAGGSRRTIERAFRTETGMALGQWRRRAALLHAIPLLGAGESVSTVALETGYATTSAFVAMFRRTLGTTPGRYFETGSAARAT
jgi:AraC-like DNA-binding protein